MKILITGPVAGLDRYAPAAREAGWKAVELPLLEIRPREVDAAALLAEPFDWVCVTSRSALPFVESLDEPLRALAFAVVGAGSAERLRDLGFRVEVGPASSAHELVRLLVPRLGTAARVLWPRGSLSDELAVELRANGALVTDPVVYTTLPIALEQPLPATDAVFLASPSAVRRFVELALSTDARAPVRTAVAIGRSTLEAVHDAELSGVFGAVVALLEPSPAALRSTLESLGQE